MFNIYVFTTYFQLYYELHVIHFKLFRYMYIDRNLIYNVI